MKKKKVEIETQSILKYVIGGLGGLIIGVVIMLLLYPERIAELKNKEQVAITVGKENITADDIYVGLKENYAISQILESVDKTILTKKYKLTEEDEANIEQDLQTYLDYYEQNAGITEEEFYERNNFRDREDFKDYLQLEYLRNMYYEEYMNDIITSDEIDSYYDNNVFGAINVEHILVKTSDTVTEETALAKATEILNNIKNGMTWEEAKSTYANEITVENFDIEFDSNLETNFMTSAKALADGTYTKEPVKTSYGYHIINRLSTKEKAAKKDIKDRIINVLIREKESEDNNIYYKALMYMREQADTQFKDTELKRAYEEYIKNFED